MQRSGEKCDTGTMPLQLDHFFILTDAGAPQAARLAALGMQEGEPNEHPGQGTANRRFFFANAMLELLYVRDKREAIGGPGRKLGIVARAEDPKASPFGLVLRGSPDGPAPALPGWDYYPDYLSDGRSLRIGQNSELLAEPLCVVLPADFATSSSSRPQSRSFSCVTGIRIGTPVTRPSEVLESMAALALVSFRLAAPHGMELTFNHGVQNRAADLRPHLPLRVRW
jgi:hypothetical protein